MGQWTEILASFQYGLFILFKGAEANLGPCFGCINPEFFAPYLLSSAFLEKLPIMQPLKNFPAFYGTQSFITVFTRAQEQYF
jgi:hypothetical protein